MRRSGPTADAALAEAQAEARAADEAAGGARRPGGQGANPKRTGCSAEQAAAAAAIEEAEARISAADAELRLAQAQAALAEQRLAAAARPLAALLAGLATMGAPAAAADACRPWLGRGTGPGQGAARRDHAGDRAAQRGAADASLPKRRRLALAAAAAPTRGPRQGRDELAERQQRFAELETKAGRARASRLAGEAFGAGDRVLASGETAVEPPAAQPAAAARRCATRPEVARLGLAPPARCAGDAALPGDRFCL